MKLFAYKCKRILKFCLFLMLLFLMSVFILASSKNLAMFLSKTTPLKMN